MFNSETRVGYPPLQEQQSQQSPEQKPPAQIPEENHPQKMEGLRPKMDEVLQRANQMRDSMRRDPSLRNELRGLAEGDKQTLADLGENYPGYQPDDFRLLLKEGLRPTQAEITKAIDRIFSKAYNLEERRLDVTSIAARLGELEDLAATDTPAFSEQQDALYGAWTRTDFNKAIDQLQKRLRNDKIQ